MCNPISRDTQGWEIDARHSQSTALQAGLSGLFRRPDVTVDCDTAMTREASTDAGTEEDG